LNIILKYWTSLERLRSDERASLVRWSRKDNKKVFISLTNVGKVQVMTVDRAEDFSEPFLVTTNLTKYFYHILFQYKYKDFYFLYFAKLVIARKSFENTSVQPMVMICAF
jgi:hypothetical protein